MAHSYAEIKLATNLASYSTTVIKLFYVQHTISLMRGVT